jgi:hypothetical protein
MPSLQRALFAYLSLYAPLQAVCGNRIYPSVASQETIFPCVTVQRLGVGSHYHLEGVSGTQDTLVQVDCWAIGPEGGGARQAQDVAKIVRRAVDAYPAQIDDPPAMDGLDIDGIFVESEIDDYEFADDGSERIFYRTILTLTAWHEHEVPAR